MLLTPGHYMTVGRSDRSRYPAIAANLSHALDALKHVQPHQPNTPAMRKLTQLHAPITGCGGLTLQFGVGGGLTSLIDGRTGTQWAGVGQPLGQFLYQTYTVADYNHFLRDFGSRIGDTGEWPAHTPGHYASYNSTTSDMTCGNFCKKNLTAAHPTHREITPTLTELWLERRHDGGCELLSYASLPSEATTNAGAPQRITTTLSISADGQRLDWDVVQVQKRPTRLPEASFFSFVPSLPAAPGAGEGEEAAAGNWSLQVLGSAMDPTDVLGAVGSSELDSTYGGSPHLRGVESVSWRGAQGEWMRARVTPLWLASR